MKKKILSAVLALAMVFGLFGGMQKGALAISSIEYFTEANLDMGNSLYPLAVTGRQYIQQELESDWFPGDIVKPGDAVVRGYDFVFMDAPATISLPMNTWEYIWGTGYDDEVESISTQAEKFYSHGGGYQSWDVGYTYVPYITNVIAAPAGYDAWKIQAIIDFDGYFYLLYPVKLAPDTRDCELTSQNGTTTWKDYYGKTVWTITEKEDAITADLTDWAAIPDAIVKAWKESGKDINLNYLWKGYHVSISIPAGEIARTGEAWYGGEYIAKVNEQYVTVKDWFNQTVSIDVLFK